MAPAAILIARRHRQVPRMAPRILFTSKESIAGKLARSVMEKVVGSRGLRRRTNSRFASALATRITGQHTLVLILRRARERPSRRMRMAPPHPSRRAAERTENARKLA